MNIKKENGIYEIEHDIFNDGRGYFLESYSRRELGEEIDFVQDNISQSSKGVLRGLHYQLEHPQGKLVRCIKGSVLDVSVDIRKGSPTFGKVNHKVLNDENNTSLYIPVGFAHGFFVLSDEAIFHYKCTEYYYQDDQQGILWNSIDFEWPDDNPLVSEKDQIYPPLSIHHTELLPTYE